MSETNKDSSLAIFTPEQIAEWEKFCKNQSCAEQCYAWKMLGTRWHCPNSWTNRFRTMKTITPNQLANQVSYREGIWD